ncbi:MAG: ABC transporter permease [Chitinophagaceae bacterium]
MLKSYFKTAWRVIARFKTYSILNISGLALGIASCLIVFLVVKYELGYDSFHKKSDRIYRVTLNAIDFNPSVSFVIGPKMRSYFPELEQITRIWYDAEGVVKINNARYREKAFLFADENFPKVFDYVWLSGNPATALAEPNAIVLTESIAHKYFGNTNAMGQVINLDNSMDLKVTGIIKDVPGNTTLPFKSLVSLATVKEDVDRMDNFYSIAGGNTFIVLPEHYNIEDLRKRMPQFIADNWGKDMAKEARLPLQPLRDIHFDQRYLNSDITPTTSRATYWALAAVAIFIILIACINFVNLATAQAIRRSREIGVRKVLGSNRSQLIGQFLSETSLMVIAATVLGALMAALLLPVLSRWLEIKITTAQLMQPATIGIMLLAMIVMILLAGLYPAFVQSAFNPLQSLKTRAVANSRGLTLRKSLVVVQFAISQIMIIGTLVVAYQMDFFRNRDLGYDKEAVISISSPDNDKRELLKQQLLSNPGVKNVSFASGAPAYNSQYTDCNSPELGIEKNEISEMKFIDENYIDMFAIKMLAGNKIIKKAAGDTTHEAVINETLMQKLNVTEPQKMIGKHIMINGWYTTVIGVVQDFQSESKHKKRRACVLFYSAKRFWNACIKLQANDMQHTIAGIDKTWSAMFPDDMFRYEFLDEHISNWYMQEQKEYTAFKMFSGIAIFIGCLGLYGLIAFAAAQRTKEVGVRKVLGASLADIVFLFSKEFVVLIAIAFVIAAPVAWYVMNNWLQDFAYRVSINAGIFAVAIAVSFMIAGSTIAYQAIRAGLVNPVKSLRTE